MRVVTTMLACLLLIPAAALGIEASDFAYRPVTQSDLSQVEEDWRSRDLSAKNATIIQEDEIDGGKVLIVRHEMPSSRAHFGAIILPDVEDLSAAPVVVLPDGLQQVSPTIDVETKIKKYGSVDYIDDFVKILPAFRGRFMGFKDNGWFSRGDFCDAWDGATDDSIAMLNAAEELLPEVNFEKVLVWGGSRGGNVALLMAMRDQRVNTVLAIAAPTDFYRESWQIDGIDQYRCQFFDGKSEEESRQSMLASSPLFFAPTGHLERVVIHHDEGDDIVPAWNAREMSTHLKSHSVDVVTHLYPTAGHGHMTAEDSFWQNMKDNVSEFLTRLEK